jgi:signal transduction histidine kinase
MKLVQALGKQPKSWLLAESFLCLAAVAFVDCKTPWQFSLFVFYAGPIFVVALCSGHRAGIAFATFAAVVSWFANLGTQPFSDLTGYGWSVVNRLSAFIFVAVCGAMISQIREETRKRLEALERAQKLEHEIVRAGDREQMRIGQDLHDSVCQSLAALDCATECLKTELENSGLAQAATAQQIQKLLRETTIEARNLARGLVPVSVEPDGLVTALSGLVTTMSALRHAAIKFESQGEIEIQDPDVATHLYRIAQEALSNATRHANASQITVSLSGGDRSLHIVVSDDGCGSSTQPRPDGMGWRTMRYRAKLIGAEIKVETLPMGGTTVRCSLPLKGESRANSVSADGPDLRLSQVPAVP